MFTEKVDKIVISFTYKTDQGWDFIAEFYSSDGVALGMVLSNEDDFIIRTANVLSSCKLGLLYFQYEVLLNGACLTVMRDSNGSLIFKFQTEFSPLTLPHMFKVGN